MNCPKNEKFCIPSVYCVISIIDFKTLFKCELKYNENFNKRIQTFLAVLI